MGPIGYPEKSVTNYKTATSKIPEERKQYLVIIRCEIGDSFL